MRAAHGPSEAVERRAQRQGRSLPGRIAAGLMVAWAIVSLAAPAAVEAHAEPEAADPPIEGVVREAPERLQVWFGQELFRRAGANALEVRNEAGDRVDLDDLEIDDLDRTHASVGLAPDLTPGRYTVTWRTLSAVDGDPAEGAFTFTIDPAATPAASSTPSPPASAPTDAGTGTVQTGVTTADATPAVPTVASTEEEGGLPWWILVAAIGLLAAGAAGAWAIRTETPS
ncbi:MAG: copper resistance protein CopC [Dehalococcoidia bacterium]